MSTEVKLEWVKDEIFGSVHPTVTYTITGDHDVMRWCYHMLHGQVEFCRDASTILQKVRRKFGAKSFDKFDQQLTGGKMRRYSIRPRGGV